MLNQYNLRKILTM